jgi:hypothetical protein
VVEKGFTESEKNRAFGVLILEYILPQLQAEIKPTHLFGLPQKAGNGERVDLSSKKRTAMESLIELGEYGVRDNGVSVQNSDRMAPE